MVHLNNTPNVPPIRRCDWPLVLSFMSGVFAVCQCDHRGTVNSQTCVTRRQEFNTEGLDCGQCKVGGLSWPLNS